MTTSNTAASKVQFMTINQATVLIAAKGVMLGKVAEYLRKAGCKFTSTTLNDGRTQFNLLNYTERAWHSINKKYKHEQINNPKLYISGGTFYKSKTANAYRLGLDQDSHTSVLNRIRKLGISFTNITSWNDRLDGRVRIQFIDLTQEQVKLLTEEYGGEMGCYVAASPSNPAPKKQTKPAVKEDLWSWGTTGEVPTVTPEQLKAIAKRSVPIAPSKQPTPVKVQPDTVRTDSEQSPDINSTLQRDEDGLFVDLSITTRTYASIDALTAFDLATVKAQPSVSHTEFATKTDFVNLDPKQLRNLADELGIDEKIKLRTELAQALAEANHFPQVTIQAMKKKKVIA